MAPKEKRTTPSREGNPEDEERKALAVRARDLAGRLRGMSESVVSPEADTAWVAHVRGVLDRAEPAVWGYRDMDGILYEVLAQHIEAFAKMWGHGKAAGDTTLQEVLEQIRDRIAATFPDLAKRLPLEKLAVALDAFGKARSKKHDDLHTLAKACGIRVPKTGSSARVQRLKTRARRYPKR